MNVKKLLKIAYHEAGHAVAYHYLGKAFKKISIIPDGNSLGYVLNRKINRDIEIYERDTKTRNRVEKEAITYLAGIIVENLLSGRYDRRGASSDLNHVVSLLSTQCQSSIETDAYLNLLWIRTRQIFEYSVNKQKTLYWKCVEVLANRLMEKKEIIYKESKSIVDKILYPSNSNRL